MSLTESQSASFTIIDEKQPAEGSGLSRFGVGLPHSTCTAEQIRTSLRRSVRSETTVKRPASIPDGNAEVDSIIDYVCFPAYTAKTMHLLY